MKKIAVVIPACNEEDSIQQCLKAIEAAKNKLVQHKAIFNPPEIEYFVVLDSCTDRTAEQLQAFNVHVLSCNFRCVGKSRDKGVQHAIARGCDWICCTDADTLVSENWFISMLHHQPADVICGVVGIEDWQHLSDMTKTKYLSHYQDQMGHSHIHGANLCFSSSLYQKLQGFKALSCHEDVDFVKRAEKMKAKIVWSNQVRVTTSSRLVSRVGDGFADFLYRLEHEAQLKKII